jgi:hypothetical protein
MSADEYLLFFLLIFSLAYYNKYYGAFTFKLTPTFIAKDGSSEFSLVLEVPNGNGNGTYIITFGMGLNVTQKASNLSETQEKTPQVEICETPEKKPPDEFDQFNN